MSQTTKILLAGFSSWARAPENPSSVVIENLKKRSWGDIDIHFVHIPVASEPLYKTIEQLMQEIQPDAWVGMGVSGHYDGIALEMMAINWRHFTTIPDIRGMLANQLPVVSGGPLAIQADFPNERLVDALVESGVKAKLSFFAGTHLCNQMLYTSNYLSQLFQQNRLSQQNQLSQQSQSDLPDRQLSQQNNHEYSKKTLCGFIHIPYINPPEGSAKQYIDTPKTMAEKPLTDAIELVLKRLHQHLHENRTN
jgi:pyroglutamyl-peptidase